MNEKGHLKMNYIMVLVYLLLVNSIASTNQQPVEKNSTLNKLEYLGQRVDRVDNVCRRVKVCKRFLGIKFCYKRKRCSTWKTMAQMENSDLL